MHKIKYRNLVAGPNGIGQQVTVGSCPARSQIGYNCQSDCVKDSDCDFRGMKCCETPCYINGGYTRRCVSPGKHIAGHVESIISVMERSIQVQD